MKTFFVLVVSLIVFSSCSTTSNILPEDFSLPKYESRKLSNGLEILIVPDKSIPFYSMSLMIKSGSSSDEANLSGTSAILAELINKGTKSRKAPEISESLDFLGLDFEAKASSENLIVGINGLSKYRQEMLDSFTEMLFQLNIEKKELSRVKKKFLASIKNIKDDPSSFADQSFAKFLFGDHPYGSPQTGTEKSIRKISVKDLEAYYKKHFIPNNAVLAIVGNIDDEFLAKIAESFSSWKTAELDPIKHKLPVDGQQVSIELVTKDSLKQSQIRMGHLSVKRSDPDYLALRLANMSLGSGFSSRLMDEIRDNKGLTYGISSNFDFFSEFGSFTVSTFTRNDKVGVLVNDTLAILQKFKEEGPSEEELNRAKNFMLGSFPKAIETPEKFAFNLLVLRAYGISDDYLTNYAKNIEDVSLSQVKSALKKYLKPENIKITVYGPELGVSDQLKPIGKLTVK